MQPNKRIQKLGGPGSGSGVREGALFVHHRDLRVQGSGSGVGDPDSARVRGSGVRDRGFIESDAVGERKSDRLTAIHID